jgi:hypothetical protein
MLHRCFSSVNPQNQKDDDDDYQVRATKSSDGLRESMPKVSTIDWRQQIYTIPNMITLARIATCPFIALAIANDMKKTALTACIAAGVSDWLDGYIAKNYNAAVRTLMNNITLATRLAFTVNDRILYCRRLLVHF